MSNNIGMDVFNVVAITDEQFARTIGVLERKLDPKLIKQRDAGRGVKLDYIGGHTVIRLLNEAFGYKWSFEIITDEIVESQPKVNKYAKPGELPEPQPPVVKVKGRLTVPGVGVKEQYGSKVLIGGASEQESTFKSASTDALKKCATLFGIGLELYDDEEAEGATVANTPGAAPQTYTKPVYNKDKPSYTKTLPASSAPSYDPSDVAKIKELKAILGARENSELDPFVREFLDDAKSTFISITPTNIKAFNVFLSKKAENV